MNTVHVPRDVIDACEPRIGVKGIRQCFNKGGLCELVEELGCETSIVARPLKKSQLQPTTRQGQYLALFLNT